MSGWPRSRQSAQSLARIERYVAAPKLPRRTLLKGLGTAIALPWLEGMVPQVARAGARGVGAMPNRMAFLYVPNGVHMQDWIPTADGTDYELTHILEPLAPVRRWVTVFSGLTQDKARANGDGGGDHARALSAFLTGCQPYKTSGANIHVGVSVDQVAAMQVGHRTRFASLEIGCEAGAQAGNCDSGYSCAYSANASWRTPTMPMAKEVNPRLVFERLFGNDRPGEAAEARARRAQYRKSVLDFAREDAARLRTQLGRRDQQKLDEYLASVRDIEQRIGRFEETSTAAPPIDAPAGIPQDYAEHIRLMGDLLVLAFRGDLTRIATFLFANEGSNRSYSLIGVAEGHHDLSHHSGDQAKQMKIREINRFHTTQLAYLLNKLRETPEGEGTLLDHVMLVYGSGIGDGNAHNHDNLPILLAGGGCGTIDAGRHFRYPSNTPLNNLYLALLDRMESRVEALGDSTGRLEIGTPATG